MARPLPAGATGSPSVFWPRPLFHLSLLAGLAAVGSATLIWPQWIAVEGARAALVTQEDRLGELTERMTVQRALVGRLRDWRESRRRVLLLDEVQELPAQIRTTCLREGVHLATFRVGAAATARWKRIAALGAAVSADGGGRVEPRSVRLVLAGSFPGVYRAIASLCAGQKLFIPDRWDLAPQGPASTQRVRAEVLATIFVALDPEETAEPAAGVGRLAAVEERRPVTEGHLP